MDKLAISSARATLTTQKRRPVSFMRLGCDVIKEPSRRFLLDQWKLAVSLAAWRGKWSHLPVMFSRSTQTARKTTIT